MTVGGGGDRLGEKAFALGQRVKAMLSPLEDVCRYREQRSEDFAAFDVTPRNKAALPFTITIAPGGVNVGTPLFTVTELPVTEAAVAEAFVAAILGGRVRRVTRLAASGELLGAKTFVFDAGGQPMFKSRMRAGLFAGLAKAARRGRDRFAPYRA
jgi:uncharacterized protein YaaQ